MGKLIVSKDDLRAWNEGVSGVWLPIRNAQAYGNNNTAIQEAITVLTAQGVAGLVLVPKDMLGSDYTGVTITRNDIFILDYRQLSGGVGGANITLAGKNNVDNTVRILGQLRADEDGNPNFGWRVSHEIAADTGTDLVLSSGGGGSDIRLVVEANADLGTVHFDTKKITLGERLGVAAVVQLLAGIGPQILAEFPNDVLGATWPDAGIKWSALLTGMNGDNKDLLIRHNNSASKVKILNAANTFELVTVDDNGNITVLGQLLTKSSPINVKAFGAVGNGIADDTAAIQTAINTAIAAEADSVYFPTGTYLVGQLNVTGPCRLIGETKHYSLVKMAAQTAGNGAPMFLVSSSKVVFENLGFDGNKANQANFATYEGLANTYTGRSYRSPIKVTGTSLHSITVKDCYFLNAYGACVATLNVEKVHVTDCIFDSCQLEGAFLANDSNSYLDGHIISGNHYFDGGSGYNSSPDVGKNGEAFYARFARGFNFSNNVIDGCGKCGLKLEMPRDGVVAHNTISNNAADRFAAIQTQQGCKNVSFVGNSIYNCWLGIQVQGDVGVVATGVEGLEDVSIVGNTIKDGQGATSVGIEVYGQSLNKNVVISGNTISNITLFGISPQGPFDGLIISNNVYYGNNTAGVTPIKYECSPVATGLDSGSVSICNNVLVQGGSTPPTNGMIYLTSAFAQVTARMIVSGNIIDSGNNAGKAVYEDVAKVTTGLIGQNTIKGVYSLLSSGFYIQYANASLSGANTGDVTVGSFGSTPDNNGLTISGQVVTQQPADATHPGALTAAAQDIGGAKTAKAAWTFEAAVIASSTVTLNGTTTFNTSPIHSIEDVITAHSGGGQTNAYALTKEVNFISTVAVAGDSVKLPAGAAGKRVILFNEGANAADVFPASGGQIDSLGANNPYSLASGASREFWCTGTNWLSK